MVEGLQRQKTILCSSPVGQKQEFEPRVATGSLKLASTWLEKEKDILDTVVSDRTIRLKKSMVTKVLGLYLHNLMLYCSHIVCRIDNYMNVYVLMFLLMLLLIYYQ